MKEMEVGEILKCFKEAGMPEAKFTCVVVTKRINTKFFKGTENPLSGKNLIHLYFYSSTV